MKKWVYVLLFMLLTIGCSHIRPKAITADSDMGTTVLVNDSIAVIYDMVTGKNIYERIYYLGDFKICENGDTLFYIPDCDNANWVTSNEWHSKWVKIFDHPEILGEIKYRRVE